jgi:carboxymethylenebutenolidase
MSLLCWSGLSAADSRSIFIWKSSCTVKPPDFFLAGAFVLAGAFDFAATFVLVFAFIAFFFGAAFFFAADLGADFFLAVFLDFLAFIIFSFVNGIRGVDCNEDAVTVQLGTLKKIPLEIAVGGQKAEAFLYRKHGESRPGVLLYTDIKGIREVYHAQAERLAEAGYAVLLPNVFVRGGQIPIFTFPFVPAEERTQKRMAELFSALNPQLQLADSRVYVDFLSAQEGVSPGPMGVVGYCFTGGMAMRTAATCPERIGAAASFHGGGLCTAQPESPHLLLPRIRAALHLGHAVEDKSMPADSIQRLREALRDWGGSYANETYEGAHHGWTNPDAAVYNRAQSERAFADLLALFRSRLQ